jgi:hypothetical protein
MTTMMMMMTMMNDDELPLLLFSLFVCLLFRIVAGDDARVGHRHHSLRRGNLPHRLGRERAAGASASVLLLCPVVRALLCARVLLCAHVLNNETGDRRETQFFFLQRALRTAWPTLTIVHALLLRFYYFLHGMEWIVCVEHCVCVVHDCALFYIKKY